MSTSICNIIIIRATQRPAIVVALPTYPRIYLRDTQAKQRVGLIVNGGDDRSDYTLERTINSSPFYSPGGVQSSLTTLPLPRVQ
jgi:hypothetical protein